MDIFSVQKIFAEVLDMYEINTWNYDNTTDFGDKLNQLTVCVTIYHATIGILYLKGLMLNGGLNLWPHIMLAENYLDIQMWINENISSWPLPKNDYVCFEIKGHRQISQTEHQTNLLQQ